MKHIIRYFKLGSNEASKKILSRFDISLNKTLKERIALTLKAKEEADISRFMRDLEKLNKYSEQEMHDGLKNYIHLIDKLRKMDIHEHEDDIKGIYEVLVNKSLPVAITVDDIAPDYAKILDNIEKNITSIYNIMIKREARTAAPKNEDEKKVFYDTLLKGYKLMGDILVKKDLDFTKIVGNLVLVSDLNNYCASAWKDTLEEMLVTYKEDVYKELGDKITITEEKDKIKRRLNELFFNAREKVLKDIAYGIIEKHQIDEALRPHVIDIYKKYLNEEYGFNLSETELSDSYMYDELHDKLLKMLKDYIENKNLDELVCNEVIKLYKDELEGANKQQAQNEIVDWSYSYLDNKKLSDVINREDFLSEYIYDDLVIDIRKKALEEILVDKGYITKKQINPSNLSEIEVEEKVLKSLEYTEREKDEQTVKKELKEYINVNKNETKQVAIVIGMLRYKGWQNIKDLIDIAIKNVRQEDSIILLMTNVILLNNLEKVKLIIEKGISVTTLDEVNSTYLMFACERGSREIVEYFIDNGIDVNLQNDYGMSALMVAVNKKRSDITRILLERGANVNVKTKKSLFTPAMIACVNTDLETLKLLVDKYNADINEKDVFKNTLLHMATKNGDIKMIRYLLSKGMDINAQNSDKETPLTIACVLGNATVTEYLLRHGAKQDIENENKDIPITIACARGDLELTRVLVEYGANINAENGFGENLLELSINNNGRKIVEYLIEKGIDVNKKCGKLSAVELAIKNKNIKLAKTLLFAGADISTKTKRGILESGRIMLGLNVEKDNLDYLIEEGAGYSLAVSAIINDNKDLMRYIRDNDIDLKVSISDISKALEYACIGGHLDAVKFVLESMKDIDISDKIIDMALLYAAKNNNIDIADYIIKNRVDVNNKDKERGNNILMRLCDKQGMTSKLAECLIKNKARVNAVNNDNATALMYAVYNPDLSITKCLVENGIDVNIQTKNGDTPLMHACYIGHTDIAKYLVENGANINIVNQHNETALSYACARKDTEMIKYLLEHGIDANVINKDGMTVLTTMVEGGDLDIVKSLVEGGADVNRRIIGDYTALEIACRYGYKDIVEYLLENNANPNELYSGGDNPLLIACKEGYIDIVKILLKHGADVNIKTFDKVTPLIVASVEGSTQIVEELVKNNASIDDIQLDTKNTALMYAVTNKNYDVVKVLVENNANLNIKNVDGNTALIEACAGADRVTSLKRENDPVRLLIEYGANVNIQNNNGDTALLFASANGDEKVIKYLIEHGADINISNKKGHTALLYAIANGKTEAMKMLVEYGADLKAFAKDGLTTLILAANTGNETIVEYLIDHNVDINKQNNEGATALTVATLNGNFEMVDILVKRGANINMQTSLGNTALMLAIKTGNIDIIDYLMLSDADVTLKNIEGKTAMDLANEMGNLDILNALERGLKVKEYMKEVIQNRNYDVADELIKKGLTEDDLYDIYEHQEMATYGDCLQCLYDENGKISKALYDMEKLQELVESGNISEVQELIEKNNSNAYNKVALIMLGTIKRENDDMLMTKMEGTMIRRLINKLKNDDLEELKDLSIRLESPVVLKEVIRENILTKEDLLRPEIQDTILEIDNDEVIKILSDLRKSNIPTINIGKDKNNDKGLSL